MATKSKKKEKYFYTRSVGCKLPAQVVGEELRRIREENDGTIQPEVVVDEARPEEAVLHPVFEWVDEIAAEKWRVHQARNLICVVQAVEVKRGDEETAEPKIAYVSVGTSRPGGSCYVSTDVIATDAAVRERVLRDAISQLAAWRRRYSELSELAGLFKEIDRHVNGIKETSNLKEVSLCDA